MPTPIDRQQISLTSAAIVVVTVFGIGAAWTTHETRLTKLEEHRAETKQLLTAICKRLNCDGEGMRQ
jgi:hypothetical protein